MKRPKDVRDAIDELYTGVSEGSPYYWAVDELVIYIEHLERLLEKALKK